MCMWLRAGLSVGLAGEKEAVEAMLALVAAVWTEAEQKVFGGLPMGAGCVGGAAARAFF